MNKNFNIIEYLKSEKKLKGVEIAKDLDVTPAFVSALLKGKSIGLELCKKISQVYELPLDFVIHGISSSDNLLTVNNDENNQLNDMVLKVIARYEKIVKQLEEENERLKLELSELKGLSAKKLG